MVLKRSVFEIQKQRTKIFKDPSYGYGAILWKCSKIVPFRAIAQFWNIFMNWSATITRIFKIFGALFLYFEYASFKYHKQNIRSKNLENEKKLQNLILHCISHKTPRVLYCNPKYLFLLTVQPTLLLM